jgi:threonine synthase
MPDAIDSSEAGIWRYAKMLPVVNPGQIRCTLGEGWTPLLRDNWSGVPLWWKWDAIMPTGSYKDRGVSVMVNWLIGLGAATVVDDSSGNAGASLACYAARTGLDACIYVPESAPEPKKIQIATYGAELVEVPGARDAATRAAEAASRTVKSVMYASHAWHPAFLLGQMTAAWEIWEQLGRRVPDWIISPVGHGGCLLGVWRGFQHLFNSGVTQHLPRLVAVQAKPYTTVYDAFHAGQMVVTEQPHLARIAADGIAINAPARSADLLAALRRSGGTAVAVDEDIILSNHVRLARRGLFVEPTSATVAAAVESLHDRFKTDEVVVVLITGHGLKNPPHID